MDPLLIVSIVEDLKSGVAELKSVKGVMGAIKAIPSVVDRVERIASKLNLKGEDKKELALDVIFALVPLPFWLPKPLARMIAGHMIDLAVASINKKLGR